MTGSFDEIGTVKAMAGLRTRTTRREACGETIPTRKLIEVSCSVAKKGDRLASEGTRNPRADFFSFLPSLACLSDLKVRKLDLAEEAWEEVEEEVWVEE